LAKPAVLDTSAILAVLFHEPGDDAVIQVMKGALVSTVNLAEAHAKLQLRGVKADFAWDRLVGLGCRTCGFDEEQARIAAELMERTRSYGLSLGDRACLALAMQRKATVYTADAAWKRLGLGIEVEVIR
jgi:PIN domain nuclease of toxin-antitoxin system